jgi:hypothetical protein
LCGGFFNGWLDQMPVRKASGLLKDRDLMSFSMKLGVITVSTMFCCRNSSGNDASFAIRYRRKSAKDVQMTLSARTPTLRQRKRLASEGPMKAVRTATPFQFRSKVRNDFLLV